jgi:hypothetical protein
MSWWTNPILWLIVGGIPVLEYLKQKKGANGTVIYTLPWDWLVRQVNRYAKSYDWRVFGDIAITFLAGPIVASRIIEHKKVSYTSFLLYITYFFIIVPLAKGEAVFGASIG